MQGQLCTVGDSQALKPLFYYDVSQSLHVEIIDRRDRHVRHLVKLVDATGRDLTLPAGAHFVHLKSSECVDLLDNFLRSHAAVAA